MSWCALSGTPPLAEVAQAGLVVDDPHALRADATMADAGRMELRHRGPRRSHLCIGRLRTDVVESAPDTFGDEERVTSGIETGSHRARHRDLPTVGQQRQEGFVLDLLQVHVSDSVGPPSRYQRNRHTDTSNWPSQASRP